MDFAAHYQSLKSSTTTPARQKELEQWHQHQKSMERRSSEYNPTAGSAQNQLYAKHYGSPTVPATSTNNPPPQPQPPPQPPSSSPPQLPGREHSGKAQLRQQYEYRMHKGNGREVFAVTMNNSKPGIILRSGVISCLPFNSGPKKVHPLTQDPTRAGGRSRTEVERHSSHNNNFTQGDQPLQYRPHERQVTPGYIPGFAGQSSQKMSYNTKCAESRRGYSPEAHHRNLKKYTSDHFPWHSPDIECVREGRTLKHVPGPEKDHVHDIIAPHKYNEFEALFDQDIKTEATAVIDWHKERRTGKKCDRIAHIERVHPLDTAERVFPTHRVFNAHEHRHGKKQVVHQGDHISGEHFMEEENTSGGSGIVGDSSLTNRRRGNRGRNHNVGSHQIDHVREQQLF